MSTAVLFEEKQVRRAWEQTVGKGYFAIVDVIAMLTGSTNPQVYWRVMKIVSPTKAVKPLHNVTP